MGNSYSSDILKIHSAFQPKKNEDKLVNYINYTNDILFVTTYKNKPIFYSLDYGEATNFNEEILKNETSKLIKDNGNIKVFSVKGLGFNQY
jgi:hypothetical protein